MNIGRADLAPGHRQMNKRSYVNACGNEWLRGNGNRGKRDKARLVTAAVMFATEDHATTYKKGGTEIM